ncbi:MAG: YdcF family protein [Chitinophagaceae bacterium]|nr:MAG: YdcF family protein [Chitinophagaceae bacterium]
MIKKLNLKTKINSALFQNLTVYISIAIFISSCQFSQKASHRMFRDASDEKFDVIVVPGVPFENESWSRVMKGRVYWAKYLYDKGIARNIMFSGSAVYSPYYEARIMALYAEAIGVPKENIFTEIKAEHSTENIYYSYRKSLKLGFKKVALASDPFQTKMLKTFTRRKVNSDVKLIPFVIDTMKIIEPTMRDPKIDYQQAFVPDFKPIKKRENFWQRFRGTLGRKIDKNAYE